jgi:hypothetical protein
MGAHNKVAAKKKVHHGEGSLSVNSVCDSADMGYQLEILIDDPSQVILHKEQMNINNTLKGK